MKIILKQDVDNLGEAGQVITVKDGYGRNFLIPKGMAVVASPGAIRAIEEETRQRSRKIEANIKNAQDLAAQIEATSVTISVTAGEDGKIFGTVTTQQLTDALNEKGFSMDRRKINIDTDVKMLGEYTATVDVFSNIKASLKFWVVKGD
jgi:large subunit ribosomal protein L9